MLPLSPLAMCRVKDALRREHERMLERICCFQLEINGVFVPFGGTSLISCWSSQVSDCMVRLHLYSALPVLNGEQCSRDIHYPIVLEIDGWILGRCGDRRLAWI